ncbi:hypothetical protein ACMFMG_008666 [Clarireedia jacksonii]
MYELGIFALPLNSNQPLDSKMSTDPGSLRPLFPAVRGPSQYEPPPRRDSPEPVLIPNNGSSSADIFAFLFNSDQRFDSTTSTAPGSARTLFPPVRGPRIVGVSSKDRST